jgi:outer membrane protein assembly factor BamB
MIYTAGTTKEETIVIALDLDGNVKWRAPNGARWQASAQMTWASSYDGARATPTVDGGVVYHLNETGLLSAFDAQKGTVIWSLDLLKTFEARIPKYGYTESVLIDGDRLICCPGGTRGFMVALNKKTGALVWANTEVTDGVGFASPILVEDKGVRQFVTLSEEAVIGVEASAGRLLWRHPFTNKRKNNIPTPLYQNGFVFASTGYGAGSVLLKLSFDGAKVTASQVWANTELDNVHGGFVLMDGFVYGAAHEKPAWVCLELATGKPRYREIGVGMGSVSYADGMLYCLGEKGAMGLVPCTPDRYSVVSRFDVPKGGDGPFWAHPVVCGGRLYIRHADRLYAYDIRAK